MMQLPSRCNTESCSDLIQENHRGICPEGWRLFTYDDYLIVRQYDDEFGHGIEGLRATQFSGYNDSGFSLVGAGMRNKKGIFDRLTYCAFWFFPEEYESDEAAKSYFGYINISGSGVTRNNRDLKTFGFSVRCTKVKTEPVFRPE